MIDRVYRETYTFELRECIGKTEDIHESVCKHASIVAMEMANKGIVVCRVCGIPLPEGVGRYNDHKVLRHELCVQPICTTCAKNNPDAYHLAFKRGVDIMHAYKPLYIEASNMIIKSDKRFDEE
jgi:hypothetical protein